jgi:hypothetical protein
MLNGKSGVGVKQARQALDCRNSEIFAMAVMDASSHYRDAGQHAATMIKPTN